MTGSDATGAAGIPPMGFTEQPTLVFKPKEEGGGLPSASTYSNMLYLPTMHDSHKAFKYNILFGVTCIWQCVVIKLASLEPVPVRLLNSYLLIYYAVGFSYPQAQGSMVHELW